MNENDWAELVDRTIFLAPETVEAFWDPTYGAILFPPTFRGYLHSFPEAVRINNKGKKKVMNNGYPVLVDGTWYSLWGMRPSKHACAVALDLQPTDRAIRDHPEVQCRNGCLITKTWEVHHVYDFRGLERCKTKVNAERFTNLANLVLMEEAYHERQNMFVHSGLGADWLKYIISKLYPKSSQILGPAPERPNGSPDEDEINIAIQKEGALEFLTWLSTNMPARGKKATEVWMDKQRGVLTVQRGFPESS
jgi:hypothetical protein